MIWGRPAQHHDEEKLQTGQVKVIKFESACLATTNRLCTLFSKGNKIPFCFVAYAKIFPGTSC